MKWSGELLKKYHALYTREGAEGLLHEIQRLKKKNILARITAKLDTEFWGIQRFLKDIVALEKDLKHKDLQTVTTEYLRKLKITVTLKNKPPEWIRTPHTPVLFYSNHEALIDPLFFGAIIQRDDIYILATDILSKVGPNVKKHILPVMARKYGIDRDDKTSILHVILERGQGLTSHEIEQMNARTLKKSVDVLTKEKAAVGMFPSGAGGYITKWYNGIGRILSKVEKKDRDETLLSPVLFEGVKRENILSIVNKTYAKVRNGLTPQTLTAKFGKVRTMKELIGNENDPQKITEILKEDYFKQFDIAR